MTEDHSKKDRREFLVKIGIGAGVVGIGTQAAASLRSLLPNVSYDAPTTVKLGLPTDYKTKNTVLEAGYKGRTWNVKLGFLDSKFDSNGSDTAQSAQRVAPELHKLRFR